MEWAWRLGYLRVRRWICRHARGAGQVERGPSESGASAAPSQSRARVLRSGSQTAQFTDPKPRSQHLDFFLDRIGRSGIVNELPFDGGYIG